MPVHQSSSRVYITYHCGERIRSDRVTSDPLYIHIKCFDIHVREREHKVIVSQWLILSSR